VLAEHFRGGQAADGALALETGGLHELRERLRLELEALGVVEHDRVRGLDLRDRRE
jgi:hypothetical protein